MESAMHEVINMAKTIKINNVDFTSYFTPIGENVSYKKIHGNNGGTMLSGDTEEDILAWKAIVKLTAMPLNETQLSALLTALMASSVSLYYFDPKTNAYKTISTIVEFTDTKQRGEGGTGTEYWTGLKATFTEK